MKNQESVLPVCIGRAKNPSIQQPRHEKRPAPAATGTGQERAGHRNQHNPTEANGGAVGNPSRPVFAPPLFIPPGADPIGNEASRIEALARAADYQGKEIDAARFALLAAALAHALGRIQQSLAHVLPASLAEELEALRCQARESMQGGDSSDIATGYQLDAAAVAYALATARNPSPLR